MGVKAVGYWLTTAIVAVETLAGGVTDLKRGRTMLVAGPRVVDIVTRLGYPEYVLDILGVWKILGGVTLLAPGSRRLKEWAYAGIVFELTAAAASHVTHGDEGDAAPPAALAVLALASWALRPPNRRL